MTLFFLIAGLMTIASWWLVVRPLLKRRSATAESPVVTQLKQQLTQLDALKESGVLSAENHRDSRAALERKIIEALGDAPPAPAPARVPVALLVGIAVFLVAVTVGGYWVVGTPAAMTTGGAMVAAAGASGADGEAAPQGNQHALTFEQIAGLAEKLAARLKEQPNDAQGWGMLARSYVVLGRYPEAVDAYKRTVALVDDDAQVYADFADALAMASNRSLDGEPMKLVAHALKIDPNNLKALSLAGTYAFEQKDYANAIKHWEKVAALGADDSEFVQQVRGGIAEARDLAAKSGIKVPPPSAAPVASTGAPMVASASGAGAPPATALSAGVSGRAALAPALAKQVSPDDTVFVFARAAQGPRMPLAIVRKQVKDLPFDFTLDDTTAMSPQMKLSNFPQVVVGARVSKSGNAMPQPGDLQGLSSTVAVGASGLKIEINEVVK